jgi:uncharacterized MnhB-related membrane protein
MRKALFICLMHPVLLGVLGALLKWLTKADDVAIIGSLLGLFIIGLVGIIYEDVLRG